MNLFLDVKKIVLRDNTLLFSTIFANENKHFIEDFGRGKKDTVFGKRAIGKFSSGFPRES